MKDTKTKKSGKTKTEKRSGKRKLSTYFRSLFQDFLGSTSFHGASHLVAKGRYPFERLIWLVLMVLAAYAAYSVSMDTWNRYRVSPTVISVERDRWTWNTSFPAVTVCPQWAKPGSEHAFSEEQNLIKVAKEIVPNEAEYLRRRDILIPFLRALGTATLSNLQILRSFSLNASLLPPPQLFKEIFLKVQPNFTFKSTSSSLTVPQPVRFLNEMGLCYSIFSLVTGVDVMEDRTEAPPVGNPLDGDINAQLVEMSHGYQVYFHGPWETADIAAKSLSSPILHYASVELTAVSTITTEDARNGLSMEQRKCRFVEEPMEQESLYSYNMCRSKCRAQLASKLCSCVPHFFGDYRGSPVCDLEGLICLSKYEDLLIKLQDTSSGKKIQCDCLPMCEEVNYIVQTQRIIPWPYGGSLKWGISKYPTTRFKRDVLFGFSDLLGSMGGSAGFFLGCSLLTGIEVLYFFTLRLIWKFRSCNQRVHPTKVM